MQQLKEQWLQVALDELSKCLPEAQRPMPAHLVEVADNNTSALPNTGMDAGFPTCLCTQKVVRLDKLNRQLHVHVCIPWHSCSGCSLPPYTA